MSNQSEPEAADSGRGRADPSLDAIISERRQLINLAYRLLGSLAEAEDAVQETYASWYGYSFAEVADIVGRLRRPAGSWPPRPAAGSAPRSPPPPWPPGRPASSGTSRRPGKPGTSPPSSASWIPARRPSPTPAASPRPCPARSKAASRSPRACLDVVSIAPGLTLAEHTVNGQPGLIAQLDGITVTVFAFEVAGDRIKRIWTIRNPEKIRPWTTG